MSGDTRPEWKLPDHQEDQKIVGTPNTSDHVETLDADYYLNVPYGPYRLEQLDICVPKRQPRDHDKAVWLIYIHGGAWRDPMIDRKSFNTTLDMLLKDDLPHNIAGFVSVDYRLSPYPSHPTNPSDPDDSNRNVQHPEHVKDVMHALFFLHRIKATYTTSDGRPIQIPHTDLMRAGHYVLCGHSCGATLALQAATTIGVKDYTPLPKAIIGIEGIYDIPGLLARNTHPVYREIIVGAFTEHPDAWSTVSPVAHDYPGFNGKVLLIHSDKDELVEMQQMDSMAERFVTLGFIKPSSASDENTIEQRIIHCSHDEVWEKGTELAKAIRWVSQLD
ncbi:alpha/beta-hydrolase [Aureobasidium pullulans]|nr:alpha/beta-hydrolase [Aureobasidium pullulans]